MLPHSLDVLLDLQIYITDPIDVVAHPGDDLDVVQEVFPVRVRHRTDTDHIAVTAMVSLQEMV